MLSPSQFKTHTEAFLGALYDALEPAFDAGTLEELELEPGLLTIVTESGKTFIVSAHAASGQMWLASPISGGLHFVWNDGEWALSNGARLTPTLQAELQGLGVACAL